MQTTGTPTVPQKPGWHVVSYANGDTGIVNWTGTRWDWKGGTNAPASPIVGLTWLGPTASSIFTTPAGIQRWTGALAQLPTAVSSTLTSSADHGWLMKGRPVLVHGSGAVTYGGSANQAAGAQSQKGSEAVSAGPSVSLPSLSTGLGGLALRVLEAVGAVLLLVLGLRALMGGEAPTVTIARAAAKVAP